MKKVFRTIKAPLKFIYHVGSSPVKFVSNKQKKLIKVVTSYNIRVVAVKISRTGKNIIFTIAFIVIARSGIEDRTIVERSYNFSQKAPIERIFQIPYGGAVNHIWSPGVKYAGNSSKISNNKALRRRLLSLPDSNSRSNSDKQLPNHVYKSAPSVNGNIPKSGKGIRVKTIAKTDENGELEIISYDKNEQIIDGPAESKFLDDVDFASDGSPNLTNQQKQSQTKSQTEDVHNQNSGLIKARNDLTRVQADKLTPEGDFVNPSQLTSKGRIFIDNTKDRRAGPLLQSRYEEPDKGFFAVYSPKQLPNKEKHIIEVLNKLNKNITNYLQGSKGQQLQVGITIVESLLAQPDTELHMNVMGQGREPIVMVLNRGRGGYPLPNHIATFERRPEISKYNHYISNYLAKNKQIEGFDRSNSTSIRYEDLFGNSHTNIGPVFGDIASPTSEPTVNDPTSEPTVNDVDSEL